MNFIPAQQLLAVLLMLSAWVCASTASADSANDSQSASDTAVSTPAVASITATKDLQQARQDYQLAREMLRQKDYGAYLALRETLIDYPLYPYLEYEYLRQRLSKAPAEEISAFIANWQTTPLAASLKHRWLLLLAQNGNWQQYLDNFDASTRNAELRCHALWAQHKTGQTRQALQQVPDLWLAGYSRPNACDSIFKLWRDKGLLTDQLAWQRFVLAMRAGNLKLARYLSRYMSAEHQHLSKLYRTLYVHPERLDNIDQFDLSNKEHRNIVIHAFERLIRRDSLQAAHLWPKYQHNPHFKSDQINQSNQHLMLWLAHQDNSSAFQKTLALNPHSATTEVLEAGIRHAIRQQDWPLVIRLTNNLPEQARSSTRAQYWLARAQLATAAMDKNSILKSLRSLALERDYYGFLAADYLQQPYRMNAQHYSLDGNFLERFKQSAGIIRAQELLHADQTRLARREWYRETRGLNDVQHYTAAHHASQLGWHSQAIRSAIEAKRWHDLELRFPLSFENSFQTTAQLRQLNSNWLIAMARQESALTADAISPAGARGLVQIMPATAKHVARKHSIAYNSRDQLFDPDKNIELASAYLTSLLEQFDDNKIYATAAYNAGPHRVEKWLETTAHLPIDVWIESIPFHETRQYVKNVLTYSAIYAYRRGQSNLQMATVNYLPKSPLLSE